MKEKLVRYSLISVGALSLALLIFGFAKYILPVMMPFLIALLIATVTVSPARRLSGIIKAPERVIRLVLSVLFTLVFFLAITLLVWQMSSALWRFLTDFAESNRLYDMLSALFSADIPILGDLPPELALRISDSISGLVDKGLDAVAGLLTSLAGFLPQTFFFILVTLISLIYLSLDYDKISSLVKEKLPKKVSAVLNQIRDSFVSVIKKYILSYSLIMTITYFIILSGLWILGVEHSPLIALFVALLDILPVLGVGTVLIPWSIIELALGNKFLGIGLILLFIVNSVARQLLEPKIVGKSLDIHPIITLLMIYVGYALFGLSGLIILPVAVVSIIAVLKGNQSANVG